MDTFHFFQMVGALRGTPEGFRPDQASGSQQPPPPPLNLAEVMAQQTELLNLLVQAQQNQQRQQSRGGRDDPQVASYQDFFSTQPPLFSKAEEPLDADAWLRTIESKFALLTIPYADPTRLTSLPNNYVELPVSGGITIVPCKLMAMLFPGKNSRMLSEHIIYPKD
jgi:hypothetical protein